MNHFILFYDGYCVFCNFWVRKLCQWDREDLFRFASIDSSSAKNMIRTTGFDTTAVDSLIYWDQNSPPKVESAAFLAICRKLGGLFYMALVLSIVPPLFLNWIYRAIASNRYQWYGKLEFCPLPEPQYRHKFL